MSACCCSLPGEKCQYNVSGSDSVHNTSAVILLCNNVTFIFGKWEINGCSIPHTCSRAGTSLPWKLDWFQQGHSWILWVSRGVNRRDKNKPPSQSWAKKSSWSWLIMLSPGLFSPAPLLHSPAGCQSAFPAEIRLLRCTACSRNAKGVRFVFSQIGSISSYFLLNG